MVIHRAVASALLFSAAACSHAAHPPPADLSVSEGGPPNPQPMGGGTGAPLTDAGGDATFTYTGTAAGDDTITACYDKDNS